MDAILHYDVTLTTKQIKPCYNILWLNTVSNALQRWDQKFHKKCEGSPI